MTFVDEIQKLQTLRNSGALSEAEFNQAKAQLLSTEPSKTPQSSNSAMTSFTKSDVRVKTLCWVEFAVAWHYTPHYLHGFGV